MKVRERGTHRGDQQIKTVNLDHGVFDSSIGFGDSPGITDDLQYKANRSVDGPLADKLKNEARIMIWRGGG